MKIGVLTSSRADFGIYLPLIKKLYSDSYFELEIIAFGTHLSEKFGYTLDEILSSFKVKHRLQTIPISDTPKDISVSIGETIKTFSNFWAKEKFDLVFALGDRYEMFAAVTAGSPFNIKFAHIHAGETTLGAIDNSYRHSISLMSKYLFVTTEEYKFRATEITKRHIDIFNVGALSIDNLNNTELYDKEEFLKIYDIDLYKPTILSTFHTETVLLENNNFYIKELIATYKESRKQYQIIITMPNSDADGLMIRKEIEKFAKGTSEIILIESFGMKGYLSCMKHCSFLLGNTSSGFVEASFFPKYVINIGDRQKGRINTPNIITVPINKSKIIEAISKIEINKPIENLNIYGIGNTADEIINITKKIDSTNQNENHNNLLIDTK